MFWALVLLKCFHNDDFHTNSVNENCKKFIFLVMLVVCISHVVILRYVMILFLEFHLCFLQEEDLKLLFCHLFLQEFYHGKLHTNSSNLPRIFGMTASPIKTKGHKLMHCSCCFSYLHCAECPVVWDLLPIIFSKSRHNIDMFLGEKFDWTREYDELKGASLSLF